MDPLCHVPDNDCLSLADSSLLTPIDRLYSMQDSYFTSWVHGLDATRMTPLPYSTFARWPQMLSLPFVSLQWAVVDVVALSLPMERGYTVTPRNVPRAPPYKHHYATASCVRATLSDLSHYGWMLEIWDYCILSSTNVNWCLGVHLYLFSKCVYAFPLECVNDAQ